MIAFWPICNDATKEVNTMRALSMDDALAIIQNTFRHAAEMRSHALAAIVLDAGGQVKAFLRQDGASIKRFEIARGKAIASLALNRSSRQVLQKAREKPLFMETLRAISDGPIFLEAGGQLIRDRDGEIVGAVGVTGDVNEVDDLCAMAGIRAAGFMCDDDFNEADCRRLNIKKDAPIKDPR
jgi:uncharacterized protein GlcG (DUF336 family)